MCLCNMCASATCVPLQHVCLSNMCASATCVSVCLIYSSKNIAQYKDVSVTNDLQSICKLMTRKNSKQIYVKMT